MSGYHRYGHWPKVLYEICHNIERVPDVRGLSPRGGGDCYLCSSYAIIQHFCRKAAVIEPPAIERLHAHGWAHPDIGGGDGATRDATDRFWWRWQDCVGWHDIEFEFVVDPPIDLSYVSDHVSGFGPKLYTSNVLVKRVRTYLEAGYLVHASMHMDNAAPLIAEGKFADSNHQVVIDGYRKTVIHERMCDGKGDANWCGSYKDEIHVVCSNRRNPDPYWIDVRDWVCQHGGFNMWFVRPSRDAENRHFPDGHPPCPEHHKP